MFCYHLFRAVLLYQYPGGDHWYHILLVLCYTLTMAASHRTFKPIFHCDAKLLALGTFASPNAKDSTFALANARNTNMLVSLALSDANFLRWPCTFLFFVYISFALSSQREPHFQWNIGGGGSPTQRFCVGHVQFMLFVSILFASGTQRKPVFQWNMSFRIYVK